MNYKIIKIPKLCDYIIDTSLIILKIPYLKINLMNINKQSLK